MTRKIVQHGKKVRIECGAIKVLKQLGKYRESPKMRLDEMKGILEKLSTWMWSCLPIPRYHSELNPIQRWVQSKKIYKSLLQQ